MNPGMASGCNQKHMVHSTVRQDAATPASHSQRTDQNFRIRCVNASGSFAPPACGNYRDGFEQKPKVQAKRGILAVEEIKDHHFLKADQIPSKHLPETCAAGRDAHPLSRITGERMKNDSNARPNTANSSPLTIRMMWSSTEVNTSIR